MKRTKECVVCHKELSKDEIALCKKLLSKQTKRFYCLEDLARELDTTVEVLQGKIDQFKEEGCTLFL